VLVALLTISVGLILPGMIAHSAVEVSTAAEHLVSGRSPILAERCAQLAAGDLEAAKARFDFAPVIIHSRDEVGEMAQSFNKLQQEIGHAARRPCRRGRRPFPKPAARSRRRTSACALELCLNECGPRPRCAKRMRNWKRVCPSARRS